jgi:glutaredoxin
MSTSGKSLDCQSSNLGSPCSSNCTHINGVADYKQASNQKSALRLLTDLNLPYNTVDGMDVNQKEKRNKMFDISGIRGSYPQIFFVEDGEMLSFLGGFDWLECQSDADFNILLGCFGPYHCLLCTDVSLK